MFTDPENKPGSLASWLDYLEALNIDHIELGLERVRAVLQELDLLSFDVPVIEVAGTNGKGSTCALIAGALNACGYKAGLYTSPHLLHFNERVNIGGKTVSDEELCRAFAAADAAVKKTGVRLTYFEYTTCAALYCFKEASCDALVLEIGLGGRLDAVNALDADVAVIASVGLDHTAILGDTVEKIAFEKAGIIKPGSLTVTGVLDEKALAVVRARCEELGAPLFCENLDFKLEELRAQEESHGALLRFRSKSPAADPGSDFGSARAFDFSEPGVPRCCAAAAVFVLKYLARKFSLNLDADKVARSFETTVLPGRMQKVRARPDIYLDVAHNPPAAAHLAKTLAGHPKKGRRYALIGMLKDKDIENVIGITAGSFDAFAAASLHTARGERAERICSALEAVGRQGDILGAFDSVKEALTALLPGLLPEDELIVFGSFVTVAGAGEYLGCQRP